MTNISTLKKKKAHHQCEKQLEKIGTTLVHQSFCPVVAQSYFPFWPLHETSDDMVLQTNKGTL